MEPGERPQKHIDFDQRFFDAIKADIERSRIRRAHVIGGAQDPKRHASMELDRRLLLYRETGNRDYLLDVAKFAMWQWIKDE